MSDRLTLVRHLIARALYDPERGWTGAATDALGRALTLLEPARAAPHNNHPELSVRYINGPR